jgi:hypothetical protein
MASLGNAEKLSIAISYGDARRRRPSLTRKYVIRFGELMLAHVFMFETSKVAKIKLKAGERYRRSWARNYIIYLRQRRPTREFLRGPPPVLLICSSCNKAYWSKSSSSPQTNSNKNPVCGDCYYSLMNGLKDLVRTTYTYQCGGEIIAEFSPHQGTASWRKEPMSPTDGIALNGTGRSTINTPLQRHRSW